MTDQPSPDSESGAPRPQPEAMRCAECHTDYRYEEDMLSGKFLWFAPKKKRGGCQHPATFVEYLEEGEWVRIEVSSRV